jgi:hypothetical protein
MPYNSYSKSDFQNDDTPRAYFWGSQGGKDVSNFHTVNTYICVLPINEIYDIENNINGWNIKQAIENGFSAVAYYVNGNKADGTVVAVFKSLPIVSSR